MQEKIEGEFAKIYHFSSRDQKKGHPVITDEDLIPEAWKTVVYKEYSRFESLALPYPKPLTGTLNEVISSRSSARNGNQDILLDEVSSLLAYGCGITPNDVERQKRKLRTYPSAGGLYSLEVYLLHTRHTESFPNGAYHYNVKNHALEVLTKFPDHHDSLGSVIAPVNRWITDAPVILIFTTVFERLRQKYGERAYRYALIEAGHAAQNIYLTSHSLGLTCCALGGSPDAHIEQLLDLDPEEESLIYTLVLGKK